MVRPTSCSVRSSANQPINSPILAPAHSTTTVPLVPHSPIRVVQRQSCHLDRTQSQEGEQQEDRPISSAPRLRVITAHCCIHAGNGQRNGKTDSLANQQPRARAWPHPSRSAPATPGSAAATAVTVGLCPHSNHNLAAMVLRWWSRVPGSGCSKVRAWTQRGSFCAVQADCSKSMTIDPDTEPFLRSLSA